MQALSILDEVVRELEQDINLSRIKKIIFFACKECWENDPTKLASADVRSLIEEICGKYNRLEDIEAVLNSLVAKVNKKTEYALMTDQIVCQLSRLYEYQDFTKLETNISNFGGSQAPAFDEHFSSELPPEESNERNAGNLFDVRQKILQQTNPLRAKILIFSTLYHLFTFSERDWLLLKTQELDNLLRQLFNVCGSLAELESQLYRTAGSLDNTDECDQAASVIIKAMNSCYAKLPQEEQDETEDSATEDDDRTHLNNSFYEENEPVERRSDYFEAGDITHIIQAAPTHYHYDPEQSCLVPEIAENVQFKQPETSSNNSSANFREEFVETLPVSETPTVIESYERAAPITINISDSIKRKLGLEEEMKGLVSESANSATAQIEKIFSELEAALNGKFSTESAEERLYWKYKNLKDYVGKVQGFTDKLMEILREVELKESGISTSETSENLAENISATELPNSSQKPNQYQLVEMAKQGKPKAIALLINQLLQPKGITATAGFKDGWLHVILDSAEVPNQETTATYIHKKLCTLKSKFLTHVKIHGRQLSNKTVAWTQEFVNQAD
ncbi:hypothetical protein [Tychonema sp. LEGE 07203]|uniref:hypothetical protein n=1 Tax=Tychonema sp. LEGE 07203 TaxID=1828671 RepID=UPI00187E3A7C|nr:hypothetical protein [Tychonema sp. LEGE 07203]MBE9096213.1 hypothetical protein [Tychonema sp. LEGE 07203]